MADSVAYLRETARTTVAELLARAVVAGEPLLQPRCGVGGHPEMRALLAAMDAHSPADVLTITVDSYTRLLKFDTVASVLDRAPSNLNGYPVVTHTWRLVRDLVEHTRAPLQIRHGSPDPRILFEHSVAGGVTSFEGGPISYNIPYVKAHPIAESITAWQHIDRRVAEFADVGIVVDRELFGTLTAVLVPPSLSVAISLVEGMLAADQGVPTLSVAYPQGGNMIQDIAALRALRTVFGTYLPEVTVFPVLHGYMGPFPRARNAAERVIASGAQVAQAGRAAKIVTKTAVESIGIPTAEENIRALRHTKASFSTPLQIDDAAVAAEHDLIVTEVGELLTPVMTDRAVLPSVVESAFASGILDVPFAASQYAHRAVLPLRDPTGAIRYFQPGGLHLSAATITRNHELLRVRNTDDVTGQELFDRVVNDIDYLKTGTDQREMS